MKIIIKFTPRYLKHANTPPLKKEWLSNMMKSKIIMREKFEILNLHCYE